MEIVTKKLSDLKPADYNPRYIEDDARKGLINSVDEFGDISGIVFNTRTGNLTCGHQRLKVIQEKHGNLEINNGKIILPTGEIFHVRYVDWPIEKEKAANITANNRHISGDFTTSLKTILKDIETDLPNLYYDLNLAALLADIPEIPEPLNTGGGDPDKVPEVAPDPVIKTGDLITLGKHKVLCGDSCKKEDVERLMAGMKADMVFTDPPYGIDLDTSYGSDWKDDKKKSKNYEKVIGDDKPFDAEFLLKEFSYCKEVFLWGANYYANTIPKLNVSGWFVWDKRLQSNKGTGFAGEFELCYSKQKHKQEILEFEWFRFFGLQKEDIKKRVHPTQKPIAMCSYMIDKFAETGQIIADLFLGSGSTLMACETTNRICRGLEISPAYVQVCIQRWIDFTGRPEDVTIERDGKEYGWEEINDTSTHK